jgi:cytochrome c peroxidase
MMRWDGAYFTDLYDMGVLPLAEANMNTGHSLPASQVEDLDIPASQAALYTKLTKTYPGYVSVFKEAFGEDITALTEEQVWRLSGKAIATYLRVAVSRDAPFDRWNAGDDSAIDASAIRGFALFEGKARCATCHSGPFFSDFAFHNVSTSLPLDDGSRPDEGRYRVTSEDKDRGAFLTPGLRSVGMTSPYFHDGSETGLAAVIRRKLGQGYAVDPAQDPLLNDPPALADAEIDDLVAFLKSLTGEPISPVDLAPPKSYP